MGKESSFGLKKMVSFSIAVIMVLFSLFVLTSNIFPSNSGSGLIRNIKMLLPVVSILLVIALFEAEEKYKWPALIISFTFFFLVSIFSLAASMRDAG